MSELINYDLLKTLQDIEEGRKSCPELLGYSATSKTRENIPNALKNDYWVHALEKENQLILSHNSVTLSHNSI